MAMISPTPHTSDIKPNPEPDDTPTAKKTSEEQPKLVESGGAIGEKHGSGAVVSAEKTPPKPGVHGAPMIVRDALIGCVLILILVLGKIGVEHTAVGRQITLITYDVIQGLLHEGKSHVVVVDITHIRSIPWTEGRVLTDRSRLAEVVSLIAREKPAGIGIDIDFSPNDDPLDPSDSHPIFHAPGKQDPDFFDLCLDLKSRGIPVILGVFRSSKRPYDQILAMPKYSGLAADIRVNIEDNRVMPREFQWRSTSATVPSMSSALARAYRPDSTIPLGLRSVIDSEEVIALPDGGKVSQYLVDFSGIDRLVDDRIDFIDSAGDVDMAEFDRMKGALYGRLVILGTTDPEKDRSFAIAGLHRASYPGVFVHAAATSTLANGVLLAPTHLGRILIDVGLAGTVVSVVSWARFRAKRRGREDSHRLPKRVTWAVMLMALLFGVLFVNMTGVVWDDFVLVFIAMGLHLLLEHPLSRLFSKTRSVGNAH